MIEPGSRSAHTDAGDPSVSVERGHDPPPSRFEVDAMLVKLARYLRCLGFDAACDPELSLATRIERGDRERRVFLTRSSHVGHQVPRPQRMIVLRSQDAVEQVREVVRATGIDPSAGAFTRCIRCNVALLEAEKDAALAERVPERVFAAYERFYRCPRCDTVFWKGSHVANTCRKLGIPDAREPIDRESAEDSNPAAGG